MRLVLSWIVPVISTYTCDSLKLNLELWPEPPSIFWSSLSIRKHMFRNTASASVDEASVLARSEACCNCTVIRLRRTMWGGPGRCAPACNLIIMRCALFELSHVHVIRVTCKHAGFGHALESTSHGHRFSMFSAKRSTRRSLHPFSRCR